MSRATGSGPGIRRTAPAECVADCVADSAGGITFDVMGTAAPDAVLVLRRRGGDPSAHADDEVRLPLTGSGGSRLRAVLPSTVVLAEGHWDVSTGASGELPVRPGARDVRALVDRAPGPGRVASRVPYPVDAGRLAVRTWLRAPHAEAGALRCEPGSATVAGVLYGAEPAPGAVVEARLRGGRRVHRMPVTGGGGGAFTFTVPYGPLAAGEVGKRQWWDLWLLPAPGSEAAAAIRISRVLDDVWDKRAIFVYPRHGDDGWSAVPCYTGDNDLCVRLDPAPAASPA
jgi:hypothetical protein